MICGITTDKMPGNTLAANRIRDTGKNCHDDIDRGYGEAGQRIGRGAAVVWTRWDKGVWTRWGGDWAKRDRMLDEVRQKIGPSGTEGWTR